MAELIIFEAKGDPAALLREYDAAAPAFAGQHPGAMAHICVDTGDGIQVMNLVESADVMEQSLRQDRFVEAVKGLAERPHAERKYPVHYVRLLQGPDE